MTEPIIELLLHNIQPHAGRGGWHGGPTPLSALRGVDAEQARWRPPLGRKSIWELTLHIAYWKYAVRRRLTRDTDASFPRSPANWPLVPTPANAAAWAADRARLREEHEALLAAVARVKPRHLRMSAGASQRWTYGDLILGIAQHDAYHTGQIQLLKRMWRARRRD